jgi:periplasmic divalent cation tolerance protein
MGTVIALTTVGRDFDARTLARVLVEARVAACVNILPGVHSVYRWEGRVTSEDEQLLVMKTTRDRVDALREKMSSLHPYEVPEFVVLEMDSVADAYRQWIEENV